MKHIVRNSLRTRISTLPRSYSTISYTDQSILAAAPAPYWKNLGPWKDVKTHEFLTYGWQVGEQSNSHRYMSDNARKQTQSNVRISS